MAIPVVMGAQLMCSQGIAPSALMVIEPRPLVEKRPVAVITDSIPMANVLPFGMCRSLANPTVAAATSAALGVLTPMPCIPAIAGPWMPGSPIVKVAGRPVLTNSSQCMCTWGGSITVAQPGPMTTTVN